MIAALGIVVAQLAQVTAAGTTGSARPAPSSLPARPALRPTRTARPPDIDGDLSDEVWKAATPSSSFTQKFPNEGARPSEPTTLRVLYDDEAVYIALDCEQKGVDVVARLARRDREVEADYVTVDIDSRALGKTAFELTVNAAGVLRDGIRSNDIVGEEGERVSPSWDENWDARARVRPGGWSAEIRVPLRVLRFSPGEGQRWGFQAKRYTSLRQEIDEWAFVPRNVASEVARYGHLEGMRVSPRADLELRPFVLGRLRRRDPTEVTLDSGASLSGSAGLDLRWHLTPDLTLDGAFNPDFTQVEGDELYLNLTNFETYFPEKRPFFVEGADIFESPAPLFYARAFQLLYTRRVGRRPRAPTLRPAAFGERLVTLPEPTPILGATKLVGRLGKSWSVGAMSALTAENDVEVQLPGGVRQKRVADARAYYQAVRIKHDLESGRAHVGFLATAVGRAEPTLRYPSIAAPDGGRESVLCPDGVTVSRGSRCLHDAYVGSVDGLWRSPNGEIVASAQLIATLIKHGPSRAQRDGTRIGDGDVGYGAQVTAAREGGTGLAWNVQYQHASRRLDFNDLGYMERQNQHFYYGNFEYRTFGRAGPAIETRTYAEVLGRYDLRGLKLNRRWLLDSFVRYSSFWASYVELNFEEMRFDDREVGNGLPFERPPRPGFILQGSTDKRRSLFGELTLQGQKLGGGGNIEGRLRALVRAHPQLELELLPSFSHTSGETRFAGPGQDPRELVFGNLRASSFATTARVSFTITPRLALQTFGQVFLAAGHYDELRAYLSTGAGPETERIRLGSLVPAAAPPENPDFVDVSLNVNVVLRWEYKLGSILYFVLNRSQVPATAIALDEPATLSFTPLRRAPAVDTLLVKWQVFVDL